MAHDRAREGPPPQPRLPARLPAVPVAARAMCRPGDRETRRGDGRPGASRGSPAFNPAPRLVGPRPGDGSRGRGAEACMARREVRTDTTGEARTDAGKKADTGVRGKADTGTRGKTGTSGKADTGTRRETGTSGKADTGTRRETGTSGKADTGTRRETGTSGKADTGTRREAGTRRENAQRGSATIWMVGLMALVFAVAAAVVFAGMARVARHRAQGAADLSALAAARLAFANPGRSCRRASSLAADNEARVTRCSLGDGGIADIEVAMEISLPLKGMVVITSRARAGPVHR